ncbi:MAG: potassium channel family protein [Planctomycetales bacterium]|nr:potassium channel family protein [Planctomycetales bacterium]
MTHRVTSLTIDEVIQHAAAGTTLDGGLIDGQQLFEKLADFKKTQPTAFTFKNAAFTGIILDEQEISWSMRFEDCDFVGPIAIRNKCQLRRACVFRQCHFFAKVDFANSSFADELVFESVTCHANVSVDRCQFRYTPSIRRAAFLRHFAWFLSEDAEASPIGRIQFNECAVHGHFDVNLPASISSLVFDNCAFEPSSLTHVWSLSLSPSLRFIGSSVGGRVLCRLPQRAPDRCPTRGARVELRGSNLLGFLDLSGIPIDWVDLEDAELQGGSLVLPGIDLWREREKKSGFYRLCVPAVDRCGCLLREQVLRKAVESPIDWHDHTFLEHLRAVTREYEELRNSYTRIPITDREEDYCHYKYLEFKRLTEVEESGKKWHYFTLAMFSLSASAGFVGILFGTQWGHFVLVFAPLLMWAIIAGSRSLRLLAGLWELAILKVMLGYGVLIRRVVSSAIAVMVIYAAVYAIMSSVRPDIGYIAHSIDGKDAVFLQDSHDSQVAQVRGALPAAIQRPLYFSIVTFTTLGYGDYKPVGRLQIVAASEAAVGAIMIAIVTVIFARRFLRL